MNVLEVEGLIKHFPIKGGLLQRQIGVVRAVQDVSFTLQRGETLSLVGESGCGKTTVSRCILRALKPTAGAIRFSPRDGSTIDLAPLSPGAHDDHIGRVAVARRLAPVTASHPDDFPGPLCVTQPAHAGG